MPGSKLTRRARRRSRAGRWPGGVRLSAGVGLVACLAFAPVLGFGFVYDDAWTVVDNRWLLKPLGELLRLFASGEALARGVPDATRPQMVVSLWIDRRVFGLSPAGHHFHSLVVYGLTCALATLFALHVTRRRSVALGAGMFFALAPLHAEPVASVNYREDLLATVWMFAALVCLVAPRRVRGKWKLDDSWWRAAGAGAAWFFALLSKESATALVPIVVMVLVLPPMRAVILRRRRALFALGAAGALWALFRVPLALRGDDIPLAPDRGLADALFRTARFEVQAVRHALLPFDWSPDHWRQPPASPAWLLGLLVLIAASVALARRRSTRVLALGLALPLAAALPSSPLFRPVNEYADRYFFFGVLGGGLVFGWLVARFVPRLGVGWRRALPALVCLPLLLPAGQALRIWRDERSLWTSAVERSPGSPRAWLGISRVHRSAGDEEAARRAIERAIELEPKYAPALVTRIYNEIAFGHLDDARRHLSELDPVQAKTQGVPRARRCAALDARDAKRCIGR